MTATATAPKTGTQKLRGAILAAMKANLGKWVTLATVFEQVEKQIGKTDAVESFDRGWPGEKLPLWQKIEKGKVRLIKRAFSDLVYRTDNADKYENHPVVRSDKQNKDAVDFEKKFKLEKMPKKAKKKVAA